MPYEKIGKNEPVCIADEVPFDIPQSWEWVRFGMISTYSYTKKKINAQNADPKMWGLDLEDIEKGGRLLDQKTVGERKAVGDKTIFDSGDILYSKLRPYLLKILVAPDCGICTPEIVPFKVFGNIVPDYIVAFLKCPYVDTVINSVTYGVKMPRVGTKTMTELLVPIPPLSEQKRIIKKLCEVEPLADNYTEAYVQVAKLNQEFPELLKKSILQEAIQGKLVSQDPNDEPASILLDRIRSEKQRLIREGKIKKDKHESIIFRRDNSHYEKCGSNDVCIDDEIPFDIPNSWCWTRLDNIITVRGGKRLPKGEKLLESPTGHVYIRVTDMKNNSVDLNDLHYIDDKIYREISNYIITKDDIYIVIVGSTIGKVGIIPNELDGMNLTENAARLTPYLVDKEYLLLALQTEYLQRQFLDKTNQVGQPKLALIRLKTSLIPMPPLEEQKRIAQMYKHLLLPVSDL